MFSVLLKPAIIWTFLLTLQITCYVISAKENHDENFVRNSSTSLGVVSSHPVNLSSAEENSSETRRDSSSAEITLKQRFLNSIPVVKLIEMCCSPDTFRSRSIRSTIVSSEKAKNSSCCSILMAAFPNPFSTLCHRKNEHTKNLPNSVCSFLRTTQRDWPKQILSTSAIWAQYIKSYFNMASYLDLNINENPNPEYSYKPSSRTKRFSDLTRLDLLDGRDRLTFVDPEKLIDQITNDDFQFQNQIIQKYFGSVYRDDVPNTFENADIALAGSLFFSDQQLSPIDDRVKFNSDDSSEVTNGSKLKRAKVRPDYRTSAEKKSKEFVLDSDDGLMLKLVHGSKACSLRLERSVLSLPGCVPKSVIFTRCQGSCSSRSVPEWKSENLTYVDQCSCCFPLKYRPKKFNLDCPAKHKGQATVRQVTVAYPMRCMCRPCENVPDVKAEKPYDY